MSRGDWFREAGYGMMIHWGLYALPAGEWKGQRMSEIGEWVQARFHIPGKEYRKLCEAFNPVFFDAEEWVRLAEDAGMKYMVVTSKHHDGFALFHSKVSSYNVVDATPFGRDVIGELAEACHRHGMKLGLYYSQDLDWSEPNGGGYTAGHTWCGFGPWTNEWDYPDNAHKDYSQCFRDKIVPQVREILTGYGELALIWFDTPQTISPEQSRQLYDMVRQLQPDCLVNSRIGNGMGDYRSLHDNQIPDVRQSLNAAGKDNYYISADLVESACTLNDTWGYKSFDANWKSPETIIRNRKHLNSLGINYLLNVGPDALGRIPAPACEILRKAKY